MAVRKVYNLYRGNCMGKFYIKYEVVWKDANGKENPPVSVPFVCYVLDIYFQYKDLLLEYFQSLI